MTTATASSNTPAPAAPAGDAAPKSRAPRSKLLTGLGYSAFFSAMFWLMLYATFPYRAVADRITAEAKKAHVDLKIGDLGPGFFSIKAKKVAITPPRQEGATQDPEPVVIDEVSARPTLLPLGVAFNANVFGGTVKGQAVPFRARPKLELNARGVDLSRSNLKAAMGLDMIGTLNGVVDLTYDPLDFSRTSGRVAFNGTNLLVNGGTVMQTDLPKVDLGTLEGEIKFDQGKATFQTFTVRGADVEADLMGDIILAQLAPQSSLALKLRFKPADDFLKRNSFIQTGLSFAMSKDPRGYYNANIERFLGSPLFRPQR